MRIQPVVLCGGSGTRLWPLSREKHPKQLLALISDDSLLQATVRRLDGFAAGEEMTLNDPIVVSNEEYRFVIAEQNGLVGRGRFPANLIRPLDQHHAFALERLGEKFQMPFLGEIEIHGIFGEPCRCPIKVAALSNKNPVAHSVDTFCLR